ncbi:hypothetical protein GpartN1_g1166.t1 [Galdieria partita]|uniref:Methyltransferase FkbM domain-containing protein n=1 Tax=Galdieria partita TaxID=83374 RepID=A0A9C7PRV9_9RHOD|nr:hypothetical protein GpartN1_g1166.t1 [Galdieria partita]
MIGKNKKYINKYWFLLLVSPWIIIYTKYTIQSFNYSTTSKEQLTQRWFTKYYQHNSTPTQMAVQGGKYKILDITKMEFYGQKNGKYKPDQIILQRYFRIPPFSNHIHQEIMEWRKASQTRQYYYRTQGTFVELGALDGLLYSNTLAFEKFLNWTGVLIEPVPSNYRKLQFNRPRVTTIHSAVCNHFGKVEFLGNGATAGSTQTMSHQHRKKFQNKWDALHQHQYIVPCEPLGNILQRLGIQHIDFLSIDVEGAEWTVLESISFSKVSIAVIIIELDGTNRTKDEQCRKLLRQYDYQYDFRIAANEYWYHPTSLRQSVIHGVDSNEAILNSILT